MDKLLKSVARLSDEGKIIYKRYREKSYPIDESYTLAMKALREKRTRKKYRLINILRPKMKYSGGYLHITDLLYETLTTKERKTVDHLTTFGVYVQISMS